MGKHPNCKHSDVQFEASYPGCMWSVFHILDYHVWNSIKKMIRNKKHSKERQVRCCQKTNKVSFEHERFPAQKLSDPRLDHLQEEQHEINAIPRSISDAQMKSIISEEEIDILASGFLLMNPSYNAETRVIRSKDSSPQKNPKKFGVNTETYGECGSMNEDNLAKECNEVLDRFLSKKFVSAEKKTDMQHAYDLKLYGLNKRLFHKILNPTDFHRQKNLSSKARLAESASFPMPRSARGKSIGPSTLKHKQSEAWSFRKGGMSVSMRELKFAGSKSTKDFHENPVPTKDVDSVVSLMEQGPISRDYPKVKVNQGWNQFVTNRYKQIKQRIKRSLVESRNDSQHISTDQQTSRISSPASMDGTIKGQEIKENSQHSSEISSSDYDFENSTPSRVRSTPSLDKYDRAFGHDLRSRNKLSHSRSLNLTNEDKASPKARAQISYQRSLSMPNFEPKCISTYEVQHQTLSSEFPYRTVLNYNMTNDDEKAMPVTDSATIVMGSNYEELSQTSELTDDIVIEFEQRSNSKEHLTGLILNSENELCQSILTSIFPSSFPSETTSPEEAPISEEPNSAAHQLELPVEAEKSSTNSMSSLFNILAGYNGKDPNKSPYTKHMDKEDADFSYIRDILKLLPGITPKENFGSWQWDGQLSNISLFKELEVYEHKGLQCFGDKLDENFDNQIIFDLVHEILVNIYGKSFAYFPKALCNNGIRPLPTGHHLIEEVLNRVNWYLSLMPELDQSLESVVSRDMYRGDNWMNIQLENERVALELEDLILDDLLDEVFYSVKC